jgi:L-ascorbate metabolism protein UlaG (beta-lactamase superfamily)
MFLISFLVSFVSSWQSFDCPLYTFHLMATLAITWLGHSAFSLRTPGGKTLLFDPWYTGNPAFPDTAKPATADLILVSHGHSDHITDAAATAKATGATVVGIWEVTSWLASKGVQNLEPMNKGGTIEVKGLRVTMTDACHSSSNDDNGIVYLGEPAGYIVRLENGQTIYFAGDTSLFGDMKLLAELYRPDIAFLPIGDRFTMGPDTAALAAKWLGVKQVVPMHWGTFPLLTGTPEMLKEHLAGTGIQVLELRPGETAE